MILAPRGVKNVMGLNFKLDVGSLRSDQQVACQRYRQNPIDAKSSKLASFMDNVRGLRAFNAAPVAA
jgi:hypothetical protein